MADDTEVEITLFEYLHRDMPKFPVSWQAQERIRACHPGTTFAFLDEDTLYKNQDVYGADVTAYADAFLLSHTIVPARIRPHLLTCETAVDEAVYKEILVPAEVASNMLLSLRISENSAGEIASVQEITQRRAISMLLDMFQYRVGIRAQHRLRQGSSTTSRGFITDYLLTLEPHATIEKNPVKLIEKVPTEKLPSYQNAERFSQSMCKFADEIVRRQVELLADVGTVSCEAEREITLNVVNDSHDKLPCIVLVIDEDKQPATISVKRWREAPLNISMQATTTANMNQRKIIAQGDAYTFSMSCPYFMVSEYNKNVLVKYVRHGVQFSNEYLDVVVKSSERAEVWMHCQNLGARAMAFYPIVQQLINAMTL